MAVLWIEQDQNRHPQKEKGIAGKDGFGGQVGQPDNRNIHQHRIEPDQI